MRKIDFKNGIFCSRFEKLAFSSKFFKSAFIAISLLTAGGAAQAQTLASLPRASAPITTIGEAKPLVGWIQFCGDFPEECAVDVAEPEVIELTPQVWKTVVSVNEQVNSSIEAVTDADHWGVVDDWNFPDDGRGDCEDYQLLKRRLLVEKGLPRRAMRMTVVIDELGEGHAVLTLRTNQGDFILDNKTSAVLPWHKTGYVYIKRESQNGIGWASLGGITSSPTTTANR